MILVPTPVLIYVCMHIIHTATNAALADKILKELCYNYFLELVHQAQGRGQSVVL